MKGMGCGCVFGSVWSFCFRGEILTWRHNFQANENTARHRGNKIASSRSLHPSWTRRWLFVIASPPQKTHFHLLCSWRTLPRLSLLARLLCTFSCFLSFCSAAPRRAAGGGAGLLMAAQLVFLPYLSLRDF